MNSAIRSDLMSDSLTNGREAHSEGVMENVTLSLGETLLQGLWSGCYYTTFLAGLVELFFIAIAVCFWIGSANNVAFPIEAILFFPVLSWAFLSVIGIPLGLFLVWKWRRRCIACTSEELIVKSGTKTVTFPLCDCHWKITRWNAVDDSGAYWPGRSLIVMSRRPSKDPSLEYHSFAVGFTPEKKEAWLRCLETAGVPRAPQPNISNAVRRILFSSCVGALIGFVIGLALSLISGGRIMASIVGVLGLIDGVMVGCHWHLMRGRYREEFTAWMTDQGLTLFVLKFMAVGAVIARGGGSILMIVLVLLNGIVGFISIKHFITKPSKSTTYGVSG